MSLKDTYPSAWESLPVTVSGGLSLTGPINLGGLRLFGIVTPSDWTAANLTFQTSSDGGATWANMIDQNGNEITAVATASACTILNPVPFSSAQYLRLRSGSSASPVTQATTKTLNLILRSV